MSCVDDDMFPRHEPLSFDPSSLKEQQHALSFIPSSTPSSSPAAPSFAVTVSPRASTSPKPSALGSSSLEDALLEQQRALTLLQQDVFALRHLLESEMERMKRDVQQAMQALEARLLVACKQQSDAACSSSSPAASSSCASPTKVTAAIARSASASPPPPRHHVVWGGEFLDSECGDDFSPSHPSQLADAERHAILAKAMEEDKDRLKRAGEDTASPICKAPPPPTVAEPVKAAVSPSSGGPSPTALSISSLTALINPAGLPLTEAQLIALACRILSDHGSVPVGKMGSLLHKAANDHTLPALLKERYGGLKKFLQAQSAYFVLGEDHPYNPHVALVGQQQLPASAQAAPVASAQSALMASTSSHCRASPHSLGGEKDAGHGVSALFDREAFGGRRDSISAGSAHDAYACSLVDSSLMEQHDSCFQPSYLPPSRKAVAPAQSTPSALTGRSFYPSPCPSSSTSSSQPSYSSRLQEALSGGGHPEYLSMSAQMDSLLTDVVSVDCEMVGCGVDGLRSVLARCSIVNYHGAVLYDCYVQPTELVSDYRTHVSGIRPTDLEPPRAIPFHQAQREVQDLLQGRVVVAHSVVGDLQALGLSYPLHLLRDTAHFHALCPDRPRSLRSLVHERLGWMTFQSGEHDSVEDARAVMALYRSVEDAWEAVVKDEQAREERDKHQQAARSAATARQRALLMDQQQRDRDGYAYAQSTMGGSYPSTASYRGLGVHELSMDQHGSGGSAHRFNGGAGHSLGVNLLTSGHASIHSALWN